MVGEAERSERELIDPSDLFGPQQPCPSCQIPMGGLGWRVVPHECEFTMEPLRCPKEHAEFWLGPWGHCGFCSTQEIAFAVLKMNRPQVVISFETPATAQQIKALYGER